MNGESFNVLSALALLGGLSIFLFWLRLRLWNRVIRPTLEKLTNMTVVALLL